MDNYNAGTPWLFSEGLAAVLIKNKWGYIDKQGNIAIEPQFSMASGFSEGLAAVEINNKYGFIDKTGRMVIEPQYDFALAFTEGVSPVSIDDYFQIIDKNGAVVTELDDSFTDIECFSNGLAAAEVALSEDEWKYGFIDRTGKVVVKPQFDFAYAFEDGRALVTLTDGGKSGFIDTTGQFILKPQYDEAEPFADDLAPVKKDGRWRFIDKAGADVVLLSNKFEYVDSLSEGRSRVKIGDKYGAIDKAGNLIIDARFDNMNIFSEGLAYARIGDIHGYINTSGSFEIQKPVTKPTLIDKLKKRGDWLRW